MKPNARLPYIQVPAGKYPNMKALKELFRDRGVFPHLNNGVITFDPPTEKELRDDELYTGYEAWSKIEGNKFKSMTEYIFEKLDAEGKIKTVSAWDLMTEEDKENYSKRDTCRGNMFDSRFDGSVYNWNE